MGKLKKKQNEISVNTPEKAQEKPKIKKNQKMKAGKQKLALIKENAAAAPAKVSSGIKKSPKSKLAKDKTPVKAGKVVKPTKDATAKKKKPKKPKLPANGDVAEGAKPKDNAQKADSSTKQKKKPKNKKKPDKSQQKPIYGPDDENRTIFVGNLPSNTKSVQLIKFFSKFGEIKSVRLRTCDGRALFKHKMRREVQSLNAYIVLKSDEGVAKAVDESGCEFKGRHIRITKATQKNEVVDSKLVVFVGNLKFTATDEKLYDIFSTCGEIAYVRTLQSEKGCKGVAYVGFKKPESVILALELDNTMLDERPIRVERYSKHKQELQEQKKSEQQENSQKLKGAAKRIEGKLKKAEKSANTKNSKNIKQAQKEGKKKSEFRGVKVDLKKKPKKKKFSEMKQLAKKIAPKS